MIGVVTNVQWIKPHIVHIHLWMPSLMWPDFFVQDIIG